MNGETVPLKPAQVEWQCARCKRVEAGAAKPEQRFCHNDEYGFHQWKRVEKKAGYP